MKKFQVSREVGKFFLYGAIFIICWLIFSPKISCTKTPSTPLQGNVTTQPFDVIALNDSVEIYKQLLLVAVRKGQSINQDSLIAEAIKSGKIKPETIVNWSIVNDTKKRTILLQDSLARMMNVLDVSINKLKLSESISVSQYNQFQADKAALYAARIAFKDSSKYRYLVGDFGLDGKLNIEKDEVISEPYVIFGEKKKFINLGDPEYTVVIGDKNPAVKATKLFSTTYQPRKKLEFSIGPMLLIDKDLNSSGGIGINFRRGILSAGIGYQLFNNKQ